MSGRGLGPVALRQPQSLCICIVLSLCVVLYCIVLDEWGNAFKLGLSWVGGKYASVGKRDNWVHLV